MTITHSITRNFAMRWLALFFLLLPTLGTAQERIVALSPAINEILFAIGAGQEVVATTDAVDYPPESKQLPKVGNYFAPNFEQILAVQPTLVVMHPHDPLLVRSLLDMQIRVVTVGMSNLTDIIQAIEKIGEATHKSLPAKQLADKLRNKIATIKQQATDNGLKILVVFSMQQDLNQGIYVSGHSLYFNDIIHLVGGHNAFTDSTAKQPVLTVEGILATQPDVVIILGHDGWNTQLKVEEIKRAWLDLSIPAAHTQQIYIIKANYSTIPSHRVLQLIDDFWKIIHAHKLK